MQQQREREGRLIAAAAETNLNMAPADQQLLHVVVPIVPCYCNKESLTYVSIHDYRL